MLISSLPLLLSYRTVSQTTFLTQSIHKFIIQKFPLVISNFSQYISPWCPSTCTPIHEWHADWCAWGRVPTRCLGSGFHASRSQTRRVSGPAPGSSRSPTYFFYVYFAVLHQKKGVGQEKTQCTAASSAVYQGIPLKTPEVLGFSASDRMPDLPRPIPNPDPVRGLTGFFRIYGVRVGTLAWGGGGSVFIIPWNTDTRYQAPNKDDTHQYQIHVLSLFPCWSSTTTTCKTSGCLTSYLF
jgi:hypothetical protein